MFDRRTNRFETVNAFVFRATYRDLSAVEVQVNPEFGSVAQARMQALKYAEVVGRLPRVCRLEVAKLWIQDGLKPFGGGNRSLLIHTQQAASYENDGILEETLVHEASHTSLDSHHARAPKWLAAQRADAGFISIYARDNPFREDVAESFLPFFAVRYRRDRIDQNLATTIENAIPHRIEYFDQEIIFPSPPLYPTRTVARSSEAVPGAGVVAGIPAGAIWKGFEAPSINDSGEIAFLGTWKSGPVFGAAICTGPSASPTVAAATHGSVAGVNGAIFSTLKNPVLAKDGSFAFCARLANAPGQATVSPANDEGLWLDAGGSRHLIVREGNDVDGITGTRWKAITSIALCENALAFTARIASGAARVSSTNDEGLWVRDRAAGMTRLALREGDPFLQSKIKIIAAFPARKGSAGQGRGAVDSAPTQASIALRITLADGSHVIASVNALAQISVVCNGAAPATPFDPTTPPAWLGLGFPSQDDAGHGAFLGSVKPDGVVATLENNTALFIENGATIERAVVKGAPAPGAAPGQFASFLDPVNATGGALAFLGTLRTDRATGISTANNRGLWSRQAGEAFSLIARSGNQAPDTLDGVLFKNLQALCLPEGTRGPLFTADVTNRNAAQPAGRARRVSAANQTGLWGVDAAGQARLLVRTGQVDETFRVLKKFDVFPSVLGSAGQTRSYNRNGEVIYLATHTDRSQSIAIVATP